MSSRPEGVPPDAIPAPTSVGYTIWVRGAERARLRDAYHQFLRIRWSVALALIAVGWMLVNVAFAIAYYCVGGVAGVDGSFWDALVFSVETSATIGYGVMNPVSDAANALMVGESISGIIMTALITGLVFAKFSRAVGRIGFSKQCVIATHEGKPTLMFRCGNLRSNVIIETTVHVVCSVRHTTAEGVLFYKLHDLVLVRDRMVGMRRGWTLMHVIDAASPLYGLDTPAKLAEAEVELEISVMGFDDVTMQTVHGTYQYSDRDIVPGHRFVDTLSVFPNGDLLFDMTKFDLHVAQE